MKLTPALTLALTALLVVPAGAGAQQSITSTTALKRACEAGTHHVYATADVKITSGPHETVAGGCKLSLGPNASFEADRVSMAFSGRFEIYGSRGRNLTFTNSTWKASSLGLYGGAVSSFRSVASLLHATGGDIAIQGGASSTIQLQQRLAGSVNALRAAGAVSISGGEKLFLELADAGIEGARGVRVSLGGADPVLKAERAALRSPRGSVSVSSAGPKALVELKDVTVASGSGPATISLAHESQLTTASTRISSQGGNVDLLAGRGGRFGSVEMVETTVSSSHGVRVQGSPTADRGGAVKVAASTFTGGADVVFRTGALGQTEVKGSSIRSSTAIRVLTGTGGTCSATGNTYWAPLRQICP